MRVRHTCLRAPCEAISIPYIVWGKYIIPLLHIYLSYLLGKKAQMYKAKISSLSYINIYINININNQDANESYIYSRSREYKL